MATNIRNILLEVSGSSEDAQRSLDALAAALRAVPDRKTIEVRAEVDKARGEITAMLAELKAIDRSTVEPEVRVAITKAITQLEGFDAVLDDVDGRQVTAHLEVEVERQRLTEALAAARTDLEQLAARSPVIEIDAKIADAEANVARLQAEVDAVPDHVTVEFEARQADLRASLAEAQATLDALTADPRVVKLDADIVAAEAKIARLQTELAAVPDRVDVEIAARADTLTAEVAKARAGLARIGDGSEIGKLDAQLEKAGARAASARVKMEKFAASADVDPTRLRELQAEVGVADAKLNALTAKRRQVVVDIQADTEGFEATIARADAELAGLPEQREIEIRARTVGLEETLAKARAALDSTTARRDTIVLAFDAKIEKALAKVIALEDELERLPEEQSVEVSLRAEALRAQVAAAKADVASLTDRRRDVVVDFDAKTATAEGKVAALDAKIAAIPDEKNVRIDVNQGVIGDLKRIDNGFDGIRRSISRLTPEARGLGEKLGLSVARAHIGIFSFAVSMGPLLAVVLAVVVAIGTSLVGALVALVGSFAAAAAGAAALGVALLAALGPVLGVIVAVISRITKVVAAMKAQDAATDASSRTAVKGSQAAAAAQQQQADAARTLADAQAAMGRAAAAAYREMEDAAESASDAIRGVADAQLSLDDARLSIKEAEQALRELTGAAEGSRAALVDKFTDISVSFDASAINKAVKGGGGADDDALKLERAILRVRQARQAEKNAVDGVSDAERTRSRAIEENNRFLKQGIAASQGYQAAAKAVEEAQRGVARAAQSSADATDAISTSSAKAADLVGELSAREREFLETLRAVGKELRGAFKGATDAVFGGLIITLERLPKLLNPLRGAFTTLGRDIAASLDIFSGELIQPEWISGIRKFIAAGGRISRIFTGDILVPFLRIVRDIALAALPALERGLKRVGRGLQGISDGTGPRRMSEIIEGLVDHLRSWLSLIKQTTRVLYELFRGGANEGRSLVTVLADGARELADFLGTTNGQADLKRFFADVVPNAKEFLKVVYELALALFAFGRNAQPILTAMLVPLGKILSVLGKITNLASEGNAFKRYFGGPEVNTQAVALDKLKRAENDLRDSQERAARSQRDLTRARQDARRAIQDAVSGAKGARLDKRRAALDVKQARARKKALDDDPKAKPDDRERAALDLADAKQRLTDATRADADAQKESNKAQRDGIKNSPIYLAQQKEIRDAQAATTVKAREAEAAHKTLRAEVEKPPARRGLDKFLSDLTFGQLPSIQPALDAIDGAVGSAVDKSNELVGDAWESIKTTVGNKITETKDLIRLRAGQVSGAVVFLFNGAVQGVKETFETIKTAVREKIDEAIGIVRSKFGQMKEVGRTLGQRLAEGIRDGFGALVGFGKTIINGLISILNKGIALINSVLPKKDRRIGGKKLGFTVPGFQFDEIPHLASGGIVKSGTIFEAGEQGDEAVLPLNRRVLRDLAQQIVGALGVFPMTPAVASGARGALAGASSGGRGGTTIEKLVVPLRVPGGQQPDIMATAVGIGRLVERHANGSPRN